MRRKDKAVADVQLIHEAIGKSSEIVQDPAKKSHALNVIVKQCDANAREHEYTAEELKNVRVIRVKAENISAKLSGMAGLSAQSKRDRI